MPIGPAGEVRPADTNACAVMVAKIATGEIEESYVKVKPKRRNGGVSRAKNLTPERRSEIARKAALARWGK